MTFDESWYSAEQLALLVAACHRSEDVPGEVLEVGAWEGRSAVALANAAAPTLVHVVDHWFGNIEEAADHVTVTAAISRDVHGRFTENVERLTSGNVEVHKDDWRKILPSWGTPLRLAHLDASHDYRSTRDLIRAVLPHMGEGGIICGDDYASAHAGRFDLEGGVERAVRELLPGHRSVGNFFYWVKGSATPALSSDDASPSWRLVRLRQPLGLLKRRIRSVLVKVGAAAGRRARWAHHEQAGWTRLTSHLPQPWLTSLGLDLIDPTSRKLEIGSGIRPHDGYVHVDVNPLARHIDLLAPAWELPLPDGWATEVRAVHALEHIPAARLLPTLIEWCRVLAPGGVIQVHVPHAPALMERFLTGSLHDKWLAVGALCGLNIGPDTTSLTEMGTAEHNVLFDEELLSWVLASAGFVDITDCTSSVSDIHTATWKDFVPSCSLVFRARKPG
ncbi:MAG TPA: class I SAM-dependent methyltransferase [Acidimicrobiales bacterium]|nr:class I SAM-dependent methyltransferase [Acidimicrobiales bacterium]